MASVVIPLFWKSDNTHPVYLSGELEFGRFRFDKVKVAGQAEQVYQLEPPVEIVESDGFLVEHGGGVWKIQQVDDNSLVISTSILIAEAGGFLGLGINVEASASALLTLRIPARGTNPDSFGTLAVCAHVDVDGGGVHFCPDPICLSINLPKLPLTPAETGSPELWFQLPDIGMPVPRLPVPWVFPTIPLPVRWSAYSANLRGIDMRVGWESLLLDVSADGLKLVFERFQIEGLAGNIEADVVIAISEGGIDLANSSIRLRRGPSIPLSDWHVGDGCFSLRWKGRQFGELLALIAPGIDSSTLSAEAEIATRVLTDAGSVSEIRLDVAPAAGSSLPVNLPGFKVTLPGGKQFSLVYLAANGGAAAPPTDTVLATMSLASGQQVVAESTFTWTRFDDREVQNDGSRKQLAEDPLIKIIATKRGDDRTMSLLEFPIGGRPRLLRQYDHLVPPLWNGIAHCDATPWQTFSFDADQWDVDFKLNEALLDKFEMPFLNGETNGVGQYIRIKEKEFGAPDLATSTVGGSIVVEVGVGPLKLLGKIGLSFNWETFAFDVDHGEGLEFVIDGDREYSFLGLLWTFKSRSDGGPFFKLVTANSDYKLIQLEGSEIELRFTRATTEDQPIVFTVSNFEISGAGISLDAKVTEQPAKLNGLETEFRFKEGTFQIKENRILGFSIAGGGPLPPDLIGEANADIRLQFEQVGDSLELIRGGAKVSGNKLAHCKGNRFEFTLDALGLEFVNDGAYHLYFLITGSAEYKPLDGDSSTGLLSYMPGIKIKLVDCPLTGNARVIAQHVEFKLKLPEPVEFDLFGCFTMEIRGFGFLPQCDKFGGDGAVIISGQVGFASGGGDVVSAEFDFHDLYVGLPKKGSLVPRFYMKGLGVAIKVATSKVYGSVELVEDEEVAPGLIANGFRGKGGIEINGLPPMAASFAFLRVIRPQDGRELRAWFIYLEARRMSFKVPVIEVYLREVGLGLGYRYTLVGIKRADEIDDVKQLIKELKDLSRTQANLADHHSWAVDIEDPGQKPKVTVALRALITQTSAARGPFDWDPKKEEELACLFLLDAVVALRSDLTFFMVARGWLNTNYSDFNKSVDSDGSLHKQPLISGFVLLSPRQKRFLVHVASNPGGEFGDHPPVLPFLKKAIKQSRFSATLLVEPGLVHAELGWPNMIRWGDKLGPLEVEFRGGAIFRTSSDELVSGLSYLATGSVSFSAGVSLGFIGASLSATANVAYGARYIGVLDFRNLSHSAFYGGIGVEIQVEVHVEVWVGFKTFFGKITKTFHFDFEIHFTASLELGLLGDASVGVRGSGTFCLKTKWKNLHFSVDFSVNDGAVNTARRITERFLNIGLEATEVDALPGVPPTEDAADNESLESASSAAVRPRRNLPDVATSVGVESLSAGLDSLSRRERTAQVTSEHTESAAAGLPERFITPDYIIIQRTSDAFSYFTLLPAGEAELVEVDESDPHHGMVSEGFYAVPPQTTADDLCDYVWELPDLKPDAVIQRFDPTRSSWVVMEPEGGRISWTMGWDQLLEEAPVITESERKGERNAHTTNSVERPVKMTVKYVLRTAYRTNEPDRNTPDEILENLVPLRDPVQWPDADDNVDVVDERLENPSEISFEPAVRAAQEQFESAPYFRHDPERSRYAELLDQALDSRNNLYSTARPVVANDERRTLMDAPEQSTEEEAMKEQQAVQVRSVLLQQVVTDLRTSAAKVELEMRSVRKSDTSPIFAESAMGKLGMAFRAIGVWQAPQPFDRLSREVMDDAAAGADDALNEIRSALLENNFPITGKLSVQPLKSGDSWIVTDQQSVFRLIDTGTGISGSRSLPGTAIETGMQTPSDDWGNIWQRKAIDQREPDTSVTGSKVALYNNAAKSFFRNGARADEVRTFEHENTIAIGWKLNWRVGDDSPENYLAYYAVTRRRIDDANSEIRFAVQNVDPLVREGVDQVGVQPAYVVRRLRSRFQIVDHFAAESAEPLTHDVQYLYSVTPVALDGTRGVTESIIATRRPSVPPPVPTDTRLEILFPCDSDGLYKPQVNPVVHQPSRILVRWSEPVVPAGEPRIGIDNLRLVFRRNRTLPTGSYGVDADARGNVQSGAPATNARKLRTDVTFAWEAAVGDRVQVDEQNGRAVYFLVLSEEDLGELRRSKVLPKEGDLWRPESWDVYLQAEGANGVHSSLAAVQIVLQFAPESKVQEILARQAKDALLPENEPRVESREVAQLEWFARPVVMPPLPPNDSDRDLGWALVPQPLPSNAVIGEFTTNDALVVGYRHHPDRVRAVRFRMNQGPSGQQLPLDLHAGFRIASFDVLANDPQRLVPNPDERTWRAFTEQAKLKTLQELELVPADAIAMSPADTFTPRIWEAWYPSTQRRMKFAQEFAGRGSVQGLKKRTPWHSWRESILIWPDPLTVEKGEGEEDPDGLIVLHRINSKDHLRWQRGTHALLDEILTRVQFDVIESAVLVGELPDLFRELRVDDEVPVGKPLAELNAIVEAIDKPELPKFPAGSYVTVTEPEKRWRVLRPDGTSVRIERKKKLRKGFAKPEIRWRILLPIPMSNASKIIPKLEIISQPWDASNTLDEALNASEPESDRYGWNALQRLGLSVTFALRLPDQGSIVPAAVLMRRLKKAVHDACVQEPFNHGFKEHIHVELLYRSDRRMEISQAKSGASQPSTDGDLLSMVQVSLRPKTLKKLKYDAWSVTPIGLNVAALRGKSVTLLVERNHDSLCHLVLQPGTPGAEIPVPKGAGESASRINVTIPADGPLRLLFRGVDGQMPIRVLAADPSLPLEIKLAAGDENLPPWHPSSAHFNWTQKHGWLAKDTHFQTYIEALGATNESDADASFRVGDSPGSEEANTIQEWALRFFDYGGDVKQDGGGTIENTAWFATAYPRTYSPAYVAPDAERKIIYDHFVDDRWASAYRNLVVPHGRYDKLWEFLASSTVLFKKADRDKRRADLDQLPALLDGGLDFRFPRIQPVAAPLVQLSSRLDEPSTPGRPAPPGRVWEVILERHPEQVLKESNHHLQTRLEYHDTIWTRFRRFQYSERLVLLQDVFFQRHFSWKAPGPDDPFLKLPDAENENPRFSFKLNGTTLIDNEEVPRTSCRIWQIQNRINSALPESEKDILQLKTVTSSDGQLLLMFVAQEAREIKLVDEGEPSHELTLVMPEAQHAIAVRHVEDQLNDSVELPNVPTKPETPGIWSAQDWVDRQGRIPVEKLSSDVRRLIDLPLRQNRTKGGALVYQFDGIPYFYAQRLFFAARAGSECSELTRLDHVDFYYVSPIPETVAEGIEVDGDQYRQIMIPLSRYWDCLGTEARSRWPSEKPTEVPLGPGTAIASQSTTLFVGGELGALHPFNNAAGTLDAPLNAAHGRIIDLIAKDSPGEVYSLGEDRTLKRWDTEVSPHQISHEVVIAEAVGAMAFGAEKIAVGGKLGTLRTFAAVELSDSGQILVLDQEISAVVGLPNEDWLVGFGDGRIIRVNADLSGQSDWPTPHSHKVTAFALSPDGGRLCSADENGTLIVWDVGTETAAASLDHPQPLTDVAFSGDGTFVAIANRDGQVFVRPLADLTTAEQVASHTSGETRVAWVATANAFVSTGQDGTIQQAGETIASLDAQTFSALPDTDVIFQYALVKPGRVIETISEIRFDPLQPPGYLARDIAVGFKTSVVSLQPPRPGDPRMRLITTLERDAKASATASFETLGTDVRASLTFEAKKSGASGNQIQIVFVKAPVGGGTNPTVSVEGSVITVTLNSTPGSESTVAHIRQAVNGNAAAAQLVTVSLEGTADQDATYKLTPWVLRLGDLATQWISSRHRFDESTLPNGASFGVPHACRLRWAGALSIPRTDEEELRRQINALISPEVGFGVDASFREALLLLLKQVPDSVRETVIPAPEDESVISQLFKDKFISLELLSLLAERGISLKLRTWMEEIEVGTWLGHSGNRTHRFQITEETITLYQAVRDNVAEASIGLEQLAQLPEFEGVYQLIPTPEYRTDLPRDQWRLKWRGAMSQSQYEVLKRDENGEAKGWTVTSDFRTTFQALLQALIEHEVVIGFDGDRPDATEIPTILQGRFEISDGTTTEHQINWTGFILYREDLDSVIGADLAILQALDQTHDLASGGDGFKAAVDDLRKKLVGLEAERELVEIPIDDPQWFPRPTQADLQQHFPLLANHLMVRAGVMSFTGVMTQAEASELFEQATSESGVATTPDQRACEELFADSFNSGLGGARIEVRTRRGSAPLCSREVEAIIQRNGGGG